MSQIHNVHERHFAAPVGAWLGIVSGRAPRGWCREPLALVGRVSGAARPADLHRLYSHLWVALQGSWLHNDEGELHTSGSFREAMLAADR